jgi:hypothetical protein
VAREADRTRVSNAHAPRLVAMENLDELVLGTTNAPYRRSIGASELADRLKSADLGSWMVHLATFFTEVRPELVLLFAERHGISVRKLSSTYHAVKASTGEANPSLEIAFEQLADTP